MTWKKQNVFCVPVHGTELTVKAAEHEVVLPRGVRVIPADDCRNQSCGRPDSSTLQPPHVQEFLGFKGIREELTHSIDTLNLCIFNKYIIQIYSQVLFIYYSKVLNFSSSPTYV